MNLKFDTKIVDSYLSNIFKDRLHRYKSWDYCYTIFQKEKNINTLALNLAFYLASWGMYRGSCGLLQKNHLVHEGAIKILLSRKYNMLRCNATNEINTENIAAILDLKRELAEYYGGIQISKTDKQNYITPTDTLISKILLGTFGCTPAYDRYFVLGLSESSFNNRKFSSDSLKELFSFITHNKTEIRVWQKKVAQKTNIHYPLMKVVDKYFWQIGYEADLAKRNRK